jgi:hypothetical protein
MGAGCATEKESPGFDAMLDDPAATTRTRRGYSIQGTLETIKGLCLAAQACFKGLVVWIAVYFRRSHGMILGLENFIFGFGTITGMPCIFITENNAMMLWLEMGKNRQLLQRIPVFASQSVTANWQAAA